MVSQLLLYSMKSAMTLVMLYVPYMFMLQKEKFFRFNRRVLLGIIVISMVLPMLNISWLSVDDVPVVQATHQQMVGVGIPVNMGEYTIESEPSSLPTIESVRMPASTTTSISWFDILAIVFFMGMIISVIVRSFQLGILSYAMKHKILWEKKLENGIRICCRKGRFSPYSWMNTIVISEDDWQDGQHEIILHESGHILAHHSYDMLLLMVCQAIQWYNPFVWLMSRSLADVHEYEADQYVLEQGVSSTEYMMLLLKKVAGKQNYSFVNGFNKNSIKQRIIMMKETAKSPWRRIKVIYVLPVCLVALCAFATQKVTAPLEEMLETLETKNAVNSIKETVEEITEIAENDSITETAPTKMFVIEGTVDASIADSCYNVYISDDYFHIKQDKPDMCVPVVDKKFRVEIPADKVKAGRIRCIFPGGELCSAWIGFFVVPGETIQMKVQNGTYDWNHEVTYYLKVIDAVHEIRNSNPSLKTPYTPRIKGKAWKNIKHTIEWDPRLYVNEVYFGEEETVLHIMTDNFIYDVNVWHDSHIEDEHGNVYELLRADVGGIDGNNSQEMRVFGGYYYFEPVPKGTKAINFFNGAAEEPTIANICEKMKDNFKLNLTVSEKFRDWEIHLFNTKDDGSFNEICALPFKNNKTTYSTHIDKTYNIYVVAYKNNSNESYSSIKFPIFPNGTIDIYMDGNDFNISGNDFYNQFGAAYSFCNKNGHLSQCRKYLNEHITEEGCVRYYDLNNIIKLENIAPLLQEPLRSSEYGKDILRRAAIKVEQPIETRYDAIVVLNDTIIKNKYANFYSFKNQPNNEFIARMVKREVDEIESVTFLPDTAAIVKYGNKGKGGAIEIRTKKIN